MVVKDKTKRLEDLISFWMSLLTDHHKDRDCHFYITHDFQYHTGLKLTVGHYGYIAESWDIEVKDMDEAYAVMERMLHKQILEEINFNIEREDVLESTGKDVKFWEDKLEEFKKTYVEQCTP